MAVKERNRVVYLPKKSKRIINQYISNMINILEDKFTVTGELGKLTAISQMRETKAIFLNWIETQLNGKMKMQLLFYKITGTQIIWVFHNRFPHGCKIDKKIISNLNWLARNSDVILLHSKSSRKYIPGSEKNKRKAVYVPHIRYENDESGMDIELLRQKYKISPENFVFTMFGKLLPFKHFEKGIKAFKKMQLKNAKLLIAGQPFDSVYAKKLKSLCADCADIILNLRYISNSELDGIIDISDVIIIPYDNKRSYMNSGVLIQSFSRGKTVISPEICMAKDLAMYDFFYVYQKSLDKAMLKAYENGKDKNKKMGEKARVYIEKNNCKEIVRKRIYEILK